MFLSCCWDERNFFENILFSVFFHLYFCCFLSPQNNDSLFDFSIRNERRSAIDWSCSSNLPMWMIRKVSECENAMGGSCESALIHERGTLEAKIFTASTRLGILEMFMLCISSSKISKISRGTNNKSWKWWKHCRSSRFVISTFIVEYGSEGDYDVWYERKREKMRCDSCFMPIFTLILESSEAIAHHQYNNNVACCQIFPDFHFTFDLTLIDMFYETRKSFASTPTWCARNPRNCRRNQYSYVN